MAKATLEERFWSKVDATLTCWLWTGACDQDGYGIFALAHRKSVKAHRFAYELLIGPIPEGLPLDHVKARGCASRACVNPAHLEPVTSRVNTLRSSDAPAARNARKTHCPKGHPYDEANTAWWCGRRTCRACHNERQRKRKAEAHRCP